MCPQCGCPGEVIAEAAKATATAGQDSLQGLRKSLVQVKGGLEPGLGVVVSDQHSTWVLTSLNLMSGESLEVVEPATGSTVPYLRIQLALNSPLIRLATHTTNLNCLKTAEPSSTAYCLWAQGPSNQLQMVKASIAEDATVSGLPATPSIPVGSPLLDASTNVMGLVVYEGALPRALMLDSEPDWVDVQPRDFRTQLMALAEASSRAPTPELVNRLQSIHWSTDYLRHRAELLISHSESDK